MNRLRSVLVVLIFMTMLHLFVPHSAAAYEVRDDPQYVVINFADFYFLDWQAPQKRWEQEIKPKALDVLQKMRAAVGHGTRTRRLAWSTLLEYMNFPLDRPSKNSAYVTQARRIMELAEAADFPVFMPLNGVQWWDELPELWNYWDNDGNQTKGCTNSEYDIIDGYIGNEPLYRCKYSRLRDINYRKRFIAGYNSNNKYNVDWQDWENPMGFSVRNWGGPDVWVAPSPNLAAHHRTKQTFRSLQTERFEVIVNEITRNLAHWEKEKKTYLFAGTAIGTEVTLNGSVLPGDANFKPFGYRALEDTFCPTNEPTCGAHKNWTNNELHSMRQQVLFEYFNDLSRLASIKGIPKQRLYTHVWSEAEPYETKYTDALSASVTYYSRPGLSLYGKATNPYGFSLLTNMLQKQGSPPWAAPEFSPLVRDGDNWNTALSSTLNAAYFEPAKLIDIYNERDIIGTAAIAQLQNILQQEAPQNACRISEIIPITNNKAVNPAQLSWKNLTPDDQADTASLVLWHNSFPDKPGAKVREIPLNLQKRTYILPAKLTYGFYYWSVKRIGCDNNKWRSSAPRFFFIEQQFPTYRPAWWMRVVKKFFIR